MVYNSNTVYLLNINGRIYYSCCLFDEKVIAIIMYEKQVLKMVALLLVFFFSCTYALPDGAPPSVCQTMMPKHASQEPQSGLSPYSIVPRRQAGSVLVSVGSRLGVRFQGILLQGRTASGDILGQFELPAASEVHVINCAEPGDSVTHNSPSEKEHLDVVWMPPEDYEGEVFFNATVAQSFDTFWLGVASSPIQITKRDVNDPIPNTPLRPNRPTTTTPPNFVPEVASEASTDFDPFYDGCTVNKLCFGAPINCVNSKNCKAVVAVTVTGDKYAFELKAESSAAWVGVGLSEDDKMGGDSVIECVKRGNSIAAYMSWTSNSPYSARRLTNPQLGIQLLNSSIIDGAIYCKVQRDVTTNVNGVVFDLVNEKYNLLIAAGPSVNATSVLYHGIAFLASAEKQALSDVSAVAAASKLLVRLHGSFMVAAWIGTASVGILLARYYRQTWVGSTLMGKDLWFGWHRIFMVLTWLLTMVAFVLIFVELKEWSKERNPHAALGTVTTILCFIQPIGAFFRPHPGTPKRPIFNWAHWLVGNVAHILGIVTIFFAVKLTKAELPEFVDWILVAYVAVHVVVHLLLSVTGCLSERSSESRVTSFPMKDLGGSGRSSAYADRSADAPFSPFRKFLLAIYMVIVLAIVVALIVITALAPIENTISVLKSTIKSD